MKNEEFDDEKIKQFFSKDNTISLKAERVFEEFSEKIDKESTKANKVGIFIKIRKLIVAASSIAVLLAGSNAYAKTKGYDNIFFMIKEVWEERQETNPEVIFSDREITISYHSFNILDGVQMQVNKLQIGEKQADLYLYVQEQKETEITPFSYKVYYKDGTLAYSGASNKKLGELAYSERLHLRNYLDETDIIILKVYSSQDTLLKTVTIDLNTKMLEARTETKEVQKVSQIKLNKILSDEILKKNSKKQNISNSANQINDEKEILILKLTDISYENGMYTVKYLYNEVTKDDIKNDKVENAKIYQGEAKFMIEGEEYKIINLE